METSFSHHQNKQPFRVMGSKLLYNPDEIDQILRGLENGEDDHDNREHARHDVKIPIDFLRMTEDGDLVKAEYRETLSQIIDLSRRGAGFISGRRFNHGDMIYINGSGKKKKFNAKLEVLHVKRMAQHHRYGCRLVGYKALVG